MWSQSVFDVNYHKAVFTYLKKDEEKIYCTETILQDKLADENQFLRTYDVTK